ncbi:MAG: winged helix-turn-helix domain-containing protein [Saprospiraceae bacterium]|nr:winged helix-turn-helix domain-containing protein [Saprospiraceae bacterium]
MSNKPFIRRALQLLLLGLIGITPMLAQAPSSAEISDKRTAVAMRLIGHELLKCWGDSTSRVLPIEQVDQQYRLCFEFEFGFDPADIVTTIDRVMTKANIAPDYLVEMLQCETQEVVHGFVIRNAYPDMIPCIGRAYPVDCYQLHITILDNYNYQAQSTTDALAADKSELSTQDKYSNLIRFLLPLLGLLGLVGFFVRRKNRSPIDPNLVSIGASKFDPKNRVLSSKGKQVELSNKEAELLLLLHTAANTPLEREVILQKVWGNEGAYVGRTVDVFISKLRKKFEADESVQFVNIRGVGYKLVTEAT